MANYHEIDIQSIAIRMLNGDLDSKNKIIDYYTKYINNLIKDNFSEFDCDIIIIKETMSNCLYKSIDDYKNNQDKYFSNYVTRNIRQCFYSELKKQKTKQERKSREIQKLVYKMLNGDKDALNKIIDFYSYKIKELVERQYPLRKEDKEDLIQAGITGLVKAINSYNENKNHRFCSYANTYIHQEINRELNILNTKDEYIGLNNNYNKKNFDDFIFKLENGDIIKQAMSKLTKIKQEILYLYLWQNYSFEEIGLMYGFSHQNAALHYKKALKKIEDEINILELKEKKL